MVSLKENIEALPPLKETIHEYGLNTKKQLGQHFLLDLNLTRKIARAAGDLSKYTVLEIGPGPGGLTRALFLEGARKVTAIEYDKRCIPALNKLSESVGRALHIIEGDALKLNEQEYLEGDKLIKIVANLPYNISTPLLFKWLENIERFESLTLMFQKEVADRIMASPGTKDYGRVAIMTQFLCDVRRDFDVSPKAFVPPPKVTSTVITLTPRKPKEIALKETLHTLCKVTFNQRRKTLRASLKQLTAKSEDLLMKANIDPSLRPETLTLDQFLDLARAFEDFSA